MVLKSRLVGNNYAMNICMKIAIIGNGIAAWCINKYLLNSLNQAITIDRFGNDDFIRTCSLRTTSINCMRGTKKGISPLGDLMVDSMLEFIRFYNESDPQNLKGITQSFEYQLWDQDNDKMTKRFDSFESIDEIDGIKLSKKMNMYKSEAYLINPLEFYHSLNLSEVKGNFVSKLEKVGDKFALSSNGRVYEYDKVILCCANQSALFLDLFTNEDAIDFVKRSKPVKGDYLYLKMDHDYPCMSLAINSHHLIFRAGEILIGSTSFNDCDTQAIFEKELKKVYEEINASVEIDLPSFEKFEAICGIRCKGRKRTPFWAKVAPNLFMISGLYKNAFSFSFLSAKELTPKILKSI